MRTVNVRFLAFGLLSTAAASIGGFVLSACESATNLDVTYGDSATALEGSSSLPTGDAGPPPGPFVGCPCDETQGLGCCLPKAGATPYCTEDTTLCASEQGAHLKCFHPDPLTESTCCWHLGPGGKPAGAVTAYASSCDGGVPACTSDSDCFGAAVKTCARKTCGALEIGACAAQAPECP